MLHANEATSVHHEQLSEPILTTLRAIQEELGTMRQTLEHVDCTASENARRLDVIHSNLIASQTPERPVPTTDRDNNSNRLNAALAATGVGILLLSPRIRRLVHRRGVARRPRARGAQCKQRSSPRR